MQASKQTNKINLMVSTYVGVHVWRNPVEKACSAAADKVRDAMIGLKIAAPSGVVETSSGTGSYRCVSVHATLNPSRLNVPNGSREPRKHEWHEGYVSPTTPLT